MGRTPDPGTARGPLRPEPSVGDRVVVRHRLSDGSATDVLGFLVARSPATLTVIGTDGVPHRVSRRALIRWKRIPTVSRGQDPLREPAGILQRLSEDGWVADSEPLGEWVLRWADGWTRRANSCLAVGDPGLDLPTAAATVVDHANAHGIRPRALVIDDSPEHRGLLALGWTSEVSTLVLVQRLVDRLGEYPDQSSEVGDPQVRVETTLSDAWLAAALADRPGPTEAARAVLTGRGPQAYASVVADDRIVARGKAHVTGAWTGLSGLATAEEYRGRGLMSRISDALGLWAARLGARSTYLQVEADNDAARTRYVRQGYVEHHRYHYLSPVIR